jgi:hypothetical protein
MQPFVVPATEEKMKGNRFDYVEEVQANAPIQPRAVTKSDCQRCFGRWDEYCNKCIQAQGHYFEGDKTN